MTFTRLVFVLFIISSCVDPFQYNPNEIKLENDEKGINQKNIARLNATAFPDTLRIALITDTHHYYENLEHFVDEMNSRNEVDFVITIGDITNFGIQTEFRETNNRLKKLEVPYITIIGNHDLLGKGKEIYEEMFGPRDFTFTCKGVKFICMDTNSREHEFNGSVPDMNWLKNAMKDTAGINQVFVLGHVPPFSDDFDNSLESTYAQTLSSVPFQSASFHGHKNIYIYSFPYGDGIPYIEVDDISDRSYLLVKAYQGVFFIEPRTY